MSQETQHHAPEQVTDLLVQAYKLLLDAQAHADRWDRGTLARELDSCRWLLSDLIGNITPLTSAHTLNPTTQEWELDASPAFSNALAGGEG